MLAPTIQLAHVGWHGRWKQLDNGQAKLLIIYEASHFLLFIHNRYLCSVKLELQLVATETDSELENSDIIELYTSQLRLVPRAQSNYN